MRPGVAALSAALLLTIPMLPLRAQPASDTPVRATPDTDGVQRVSIVAGSYFFKPMHIVVKARTPVELSIVKEQGITPHDFVIQAADAGIMVDAKLGTEPTKVTFIPKAAGKYIFYCSNKFLFLPSHRERGMEGVLEVVD